MEFQDIAYTFRIAVAHRRFQCLGRTESQRFNVRFQLRPGGEAVFVGQGVLRIGQFALRTLRSSSLACFLRYSRLVFQVADETLLLLLWPGVRYDGQKRSQCSMLRNLFRWDHPFPRTGCNLFCGSHYIKSTVTRRRSALDYVRLTDTGIQRSVATLRIRTTARHLPLRLTAFAAELTTALASHPTAASIPASPSGYGCPPSCHPPGDRSLRPSL